MKVGVSPGVPQSRDLLEVAADVEEYAKLVRQHRRTSASSTSSAWQQPYRADSFQATNSTASRSFVSKSASSNEPVAVVSPAASREELEETTSECGESVEKCLYPNTVPHPVLIFHPSRPYQNPPPRPALFGHSSHHYDRSGQQSAKYDAGSRPVRDTAPVLEDEKVKHSSTKSPTNEVSGGDKAEDVVEASEGEEAQASIFQPVAGVQGNRPRNWQNRHKRSESPDAHWHRKL